MLGLYHLKRGSRSGDVKASRNKDRTSAVMAKPMPKPYDVCFKLLLIGDSEVGKTCILNRFTNDEFNSTFIATLGEKRKRIRESVGESCKAVFFKGGLK